MRWFFFCPCFGIFVLATDVLSRITPSLIIVSIASKPYVIDPADIVLAGTTVSADGPAVTIDGALVSEDKDEDVFVDGIEVFTGPRDPFTTTFNVFSRPTSRETEGSSVSGATNSDHVFDTAISTTSSNSPIITSSGTYSADSAVKNIPIGTSKVSVTALGSNPGNLKSNSTSTYTTLTQSLRAAGVNPRSNSSSSRSSSSISNFAGTATMKALSGGSAASSLSSKLSSRPFSINAIPTNAVTSSNGMTTPAIALSLSPESSNARSGGIVAQTAPASVTSASSLADTLVSTNQTSTISTSISSTIFVNAVVHSNITLLGLQASGNTQLSGGTLLSSVSSSAHANLTSSTSILPSLTLLTNLTKQKLAAPSNSFPTSSNSGTHTVSPITQIAIPTTSLTPTNAAAIADGVAIGGELALLCDKARSISDLTALAASKPSIIASIETLKSDLKRLSLDLGGSGIPTCGKSRFRFRSRRRSILGRLLGTIASTVCNLIKVQAEIDIIAPDLVEIAAVWVVIEGLAEVLKEEEKEEEEEEEKEEEESQSAEEERASETAKKKTLSTSTRKASVSSVSSTSVSRTPIPYITELCQPYPTAIDDSAAADNIVLAMAAFELSLVFGSSGGGGGGGSGGSGGGGLIGNSTSSNSIKSTTGGLTTAITSVSSNLQASAAIPVSEAFISSASVSAASARKASFSALSISAASVSRASISAASMSSASALRASISAASVSALSASVASASRASVSAASFSSASASAASASTVSVSAASISAASVSAAAVSFPTQLTSNSGGSRLCKSIGPGPCVNAYSLYNSSYLYTQYTSYVHTAGGFDGKWLGWGCAAMFTCDTDEAYAKGMTGQQILNAFHYLYSKDDVTICGSIYMGNECHLTVNACDLCESSIPCESLPKQFQPPHGDVPCYWDDGTTWPPTPPPENGCGRGLDKRYVC